MAKASNEGAIKGMVAAINTAVIIKPETMCFIVALLNRMSVIPTEKEYILELAPYSYTWLALRQSYVFV